MSRRLAVAALAALCLLSGCGSGDEEAAPDRFFGLSPAKVPVATDFARMADGGVGSYRLPLAWSTVEAVEGEYDWTVYDATLRELARNGIEPVANVLGTPAAYAPKVTDPPTSSDEAFDAWADFLDAAARRYGPGGEFWQVMAAAEPDLEPQPIEIWEIWNEPNTALFWTPRPEPSAYADLLKRSARVIGKVEPEAQIMVGGMFATPQSDGAIVSFDFLDQLLAIGGVADAADLVGLHPYGPEVDAVIAQLDQTRAALDDAGEDAGLWVTELGWGSDPQVPNDLAKTPEQQADLLSESLGTMEEDREKWDLQGVIWFTWRDSAGPVGDCLWCRTAGLLDADGDTKPAWSAYTDLTGGEP